jgi:hypothetical protein
VAEIMTAIIKIKEDVEDFHNLPEYRSLLSQQVLAQRELKEAEQIAELQVYFAPAKLSALEKMIFAPSTRWNFPTVVLDQPVYHALNEQEKVELTLKFSVSIYDPQTKQTEPYSYEWKTAEADLFPKGKTLGLGSKKDSSKPD